MGREQGRELGELGAADDRARQAGQAVDALQPGAAQVGVGEGGPADVEPVEA